MEEKRPAQVKETQSPYGEQDEWGNSIDALRRNLKLSYAERLERAAEGAKAAHILKHEFKRLT